MFFPEGLSPTRGANSPLTKMNDSLDYRQNYTQASFSNLNNLMENSQSPTKFSPVKAKIYEDLEKKDKKSLKKRARRKVFGIPGNLS